MHCTIFKVAYQGTHCTKARGNHSNSNSFLYTSPLEEFIQVLDRILDHTTIYLSQVMSYTLDFASNYFILALQFTGLPRIVIRIDVIIAWPIYHLQFKTYIPKEN